jgi:histidine kinase/DNA gyrase B/HSP90-like ATPase
VLGSNVVATWAQVVVAMTAPVARTIQPTTGRKVVFLRDIVTPEAVSEDGNQDEWFSANNLSTTLPRGSKVRHSGIDPNLISGIFEAFVTTKKKGMGLGLAICRRIIESHGGKLTAFSDGNSGARFQIVLPVGHEIFASKR